MNKHLKDCGKNVVKSAIDCSQLIGKQDALGATSCLISLKETADSCMKAIKENPQMEAPKRNFQFQNRVRDNYLRYRYRERSDEDLPELNTKSKTMKISVICQQCQNQQSLLVKTGEESMIKCQICGCISNFSIKN
jgi:hypothetical protein